MKLAANLSGPTPNTPTTVAGNTAGPNTGYTVNVDLSRYDQICVYASLSAVGGGGTIDVYLQNSPDDGATWVDWLHFAQVANGATLQVEQAQIMNTTAAFPVVGTGLTPALAAGSAVGSHPGDRLRVVFKTGAGWSAAVNQTISIYGVERMVNR